MEKLNIIHVDMDAFYAAVEEYDNPELRGKPVIVGGLSEKGVVTTANYEARKYGVHSAMPIFMARKKCPGGFFVPSRMKRYQEVSKEVFKILYEFTDLVEKISIDEAYLDISKLDMEALKVVEKIKKRVMDSTGLTMSIGISYNKFLAKLASDWNKPNGVKIISPDMVPEILLPLPVKAVHGIGPKSAKRLNNIGVYNIKDLLRLSEEFLVELFGKSGRETYNRIRGIDHREVDTCRERKSLGIERTFKEQTNDINILKSYLKSFSSQLALELENKRIHSRTVIVKIKDEHFRTQTRSKTLTSHISSEKELFEIGESLLEDIEINGNVRLLGITAANLISLDLEQLSLFD